LNINVKAIVDKISTTQRDRDVFGAGATRIANSTVGPGGGEPESEFATVNGIN
jgi:hypothetical protein